MVILNQVNILSSLFLFILFYVFVLTFGCYDFHNKWYQSSGEKIVRKIILKIISDFKYDINY